MSVTYDPFISVVVDVAEDERGSGSSGSSSPGSGGGGSSVAAGSNSVFIVTVSPSSSLWDILRSEKHQNSWCIYILIKLSLFFSLSICLRLQHISSASRVSEPSKFGTAPAPAFSKKPSVSAECYDQPE